MIQDARLDLTHPELQLIGIREFTEMTQTLLLDLEFTCWEGSLRDGWSDPAQPPEVIEIGVVAYDCEGEKLRGCYTTYVRPQLNPELSTYCRHLVQVSQREIDDAPPLAEALWRVADWKKRLGVSDLSTCSWGINDRIFLAQDASRKGAEDPFRDTAHVDLRELWRACLPGEAVLAPMLGRDDIRGVLGLSPNADRHRALSDARDLIQFWRALSDHLNSQGVRAQTRIVTS